MRFLLYQKVRQSYWILVQILRDLYNKELLLNYFEFNKRCKNAFEDSNKNLLSIQLYSFQQNRFNGLWFSQRQPVSMRVNTTKNFVLNFRILTTVLIMLLRKSLFLNQVGSNSKKPKFQEPTKIDFLKSNLRRKAKNGRT